MPDLPHIRFENGAMGMRHYETIYIINPDLTEEDCREVVDKVNGLVEKNQGVVTLVEEWGKRGLAYDVKKHDKGYYVLLQYCGEAGITAEIKRNLRLDDRVIKSQTIKLADKADPEALKSQAAESTRVSADVEEIDSIGDSLEEDQEENGL